MDRLNNIASYFNEKERRKLDNIAKNSPSGLPEMTFEEIRLSCLENNGYETPELNDKIYLHFRGFRKIENLDKFTGCKAIWLESNGFSKLENLEALVDLRCLYLSKNLISKIEGLDCLKNLTILDLSNNRIATIENLSCCPNLQTLNLAHNTLSNVASIEHLKDCPLLNNIDITNNRLEADEAFFQTFSGIPSLAALSLNGNDITKMASFRKRLIASNPRLGYLDRPIDQQERVFAEAFVSGGAEAEAAARAQWKLDAEQKRIDELATFKAWQAEQQAIRAAACAEGRSLITEFTPEEQATRAAEAEAASAAEKAMLDLGIGKVASRYWQLEARNASSSGLGGGVDALELATAQLLAEQQQAANAVSVQSTQVEELRDLDETVAEDSIHISHTADMDEINVELEAATLSPTTDTESATPVPAENAETPAVDEEVNTAAEETKSDPIAAGAAAILGMSEAEMQAIRDERVAESFHIYKKQLEAQKAGKVALPPPSKPSTWDTPAVTVPEAERPLYWSESMDMHLAKLVKACVFDFDAISATMQQLAEKNALSSTQAHKAPARLSNEACRLRWAQLDAEQWGTVAPNSSALDTQFKVCISSAVLGTGHGSQPSYDALASIAAGSAPTYLKVPTAFPSVQDTAGDDSDMELD